MGLLKMFWTFQLSFDENALAFFSLTIVLATFPQIWAIFSQSSGHPGSVHIGQIFEFDKLILFLKM
jgi:hypothetical protein